MELLYGLILSLLVALPATYLGKLFPVIGAPVISIFIGMAIMPFVSKRKIFDKGLNFTSKIILQTAVVLLGFSLSLNAIVKSGIESLPIIASTIFVALLSAFFLKKLLHIDANSAILVGVGSSICGGSAIAATAPVIDASDEEIAKSISVIFLFNVIAALIFPSLGAYIGMSDYGFALFAGTAINDTSSVTAAASIWDSLHHSNTLETATVVKLTRTLAIIPIVLALSIYTQKRRAKSSEEGKRKKMSILKLIPTFLILFLLASLIASFIPLPEIFIKNAKFLSKFFISMAMASVGMKTSLIRLVKTGGKAIVLGFFCWTLILLSSLGMQHLLGFL